MKLVGILNITPDSFSDGGKFLDSSTIYNFLESVKDKISIIDIGAESTRPGAIPLNYKQEWERLTELPKIIKYCHDNNIEVSLDSYHVENIKKALEIGIDYINDVDSKNEEIINLIVQYKAKYIFTHSLSVPADKNQIITGDTIEEILNWAKIKKDLLLKKLDISQIIFDPGIGFGKNKEQSFEIINNIDRFKELNIPIYVGHSRKSFLNDYDKDIATLAISAYLKNKVDYIRIHNIDLHYEFFKLQNRLK